MTTYSDSFGALNFWAIGDSWEDSSEADVAVERVPWGDYTIVDLGGKGPETLTLEALVAGNPRATLRTLEGTQAALSCPQYSGTAVLKSWSLSETEQSRTAGERVAKLTFLVDVV